MSTPIDVYELKSKTRGYKFFAIAFPGDQQRPVSAFDDKESAAVGRVKHLLEIGGDTEEADDDEDFGGDLI